MLDVRWFFRAWRASGRDGGSRARRRLAGAASAGLLLFARLRRGTATLGDGHVPTLWVEVSATLAAFTLFLLPQLAGLLVRAHAEALGFQLQHRGERLAWPDAVPAHRRTVLPLESRPAASASREPLELDTSGKPSPLLLEPLAGARDPDSGE